MGTARGIASADQVVAETKRGRAGCSRPGQVVDAEVPGSARCAVGSDRPPGQRLSAGAPVGASGLWQDGDAAIVGGTAAGGGRMVVVRSDGCRADAVHVMPVDSAL